MERKKEEKHGRKIKCLTLPLLTVRVLNTAFVFMFVLPVQGLDQAPDYITCGVCVQVF